MCGSDRPEDYRVPDIYQPDQEEVRRIQQERLAMLQYEQVTVQVIKNHATEIFSACCQIHI